MKNPTLPENVANCDQEPIHALGLVQPHGALLCFDRNGALIAQSENAATLLGPLPALRNALSEDHLDRCARLAIDKAMVERNESLESVECMAQSGERFDLVMHWSGDTLVVEFEQVPPDTPGASQFAMYSQRAIQRLQARQYANVADLLQETAEAIRTMTGFDRVMGYRFLGDGSGEVIAEAHRDDLSPYLHQRYPASDIPAQARRLYLLNPIRQIASVASKPVPIVPSMNPHTHAPFDLSHSVLRSVSSVHIEYLKNMGVCASMSVSIIVEGKLWGLFACHHMSPYRASHAVRLSCTVLTQVVSILVSQTEARLSLSHDHRTHESAQRIMSELAHADDFVSGLVRAGPAIVDLVDCDAAFAVVDHEVLPLGGSRLVHRTELCALAAHMIDTRTDTLVTDSWQRDFPALAPIPSASGAAAGCMAVHVGGDAPVTIVWLRDELVETINWAGPPEKVIAQGPNGPRLTPRGSFEVWKQTVTGSSREWSDADQRAARELKAVLQDVALQRMREAERARTTLLATLGHDLRNPLQAINMAMLLMGRGLATSTDTAKRVEGSTRRMQSLINYILDVSRIRSGLGLGLSREVVGLKEVIESTVEQNRLAHPGVTICAHVTDDIGDAYIDEDRFSQALTNLISNARQHGDISHPIELNARAEGSIQVVEISNRLRERPGTSFQRLLDPFKSGSLNNTNNRGGLGLGLYIANAIIKGHDAQLDGYFDATHARVVIRLARLAEQRAA
ncbi:GAF domain-containing protein [Caballeronia sp. ATUFL_M2_KS44]|uniref:GAF domain-containing protein n=1 Tax=Caballeronia sp. ATUFL_M2_KS44 TaxID=2921767 RepID=UPI0020299112|nr:GAF domain-containing protein [Caballeronia sp. ATUFL_M2_KS44]